MEKTDSKGKGKIGIEIDKEGKVKGKYTHKGKHHETNLNMENGKVNSGSYKHFGSNHKFELKIERGKFGGVSYSTKIEKDKTLNVNVDKNGKPSVSIGIKF